MSRDAVEPRAKRDELVEALLLEGRKMSTHTVLFSQAVAERLGIKQSDMECGDILNWTGPISAGRLARLSGLTTGAITGVVDRLEAAGYVRRERDPDDRRRVIIHPLPEREREVLPYFRPLGRAFDELCSRYDEDELAAILDYLTRVNRILVQQTAGLREGEAPVATGSSAER